ASSFSNDVNPFISSFDADNGNLLNIKYYKAAGTESDIRKLYKYADGYIALVYLWYADPDKGRHVYIKFDRDLNPIVVKRIKGYTNTTSDHQFTFLPEQDGSFYMAFGSSFDLALTKINSNDSVLWVKDMPGYYDG